MARTGLTKDAGWEIGVSKAVPYPLEQVWDLIVSDEGAAMWLGPGAHIPETAGETWTSEEAAGQLRSRRPHDRVRTTYAPQSGDAESTLQVTVSPAAGGGTTLRFHQERMAGPDERERQRAHWQQVVERIVASLDV